ncbi:MAG: bifunctional adenosylcobinamide kinase/adenosylcobinamide-phosphate guanylyltransferase [Leptolyngbyaceae cyanobacterium bins.302]|nr:bifunctional adenosylcobinamide kinase/adenosylcobinamide-phosphate guanylyltransferase [Leptolyngbyaceae cyanobacterium bins.302]
MADLILVTGAARSGKSEWAEALAHQSGRTVVYVATAQIDETDAEWQARIARHQQRRSPDWITLPIPIALAETIALATADQCLLIDSLGTWLANRLAEDEPTWEKTVSKLVAALAQTSCQIILVAEETGWGVVPAYPLGRTFRDRLGALTRTIGTIANPVYLVAAGYALNLTHLGQVVGEQGEQGTFRT